MLFKFDRAVCDEPSCLLCQMAYRRPPQWWRFTGLLKEAIKHVDAVISPSRFGRDIHHQRGLDAPIVHLPSFVPSSGNEPSASQSRVAKVPEQPYFLFVGRLEELKGLHTLIPVFRRYRKARLVIVGTGSYEPELRDLAQDDPVLHFLGRLSSQQLEDLYRHAVALILPSICYEMFSLVILEAFAQRTPVIVRNRGGMREVVEESGGGLTFDTEPELVAAMDRFLQDPSYRDQLGQRGHQAYLQKWTVEAHLERYFDLIRDIAATRAKTTSGDLPGD